MFIVNAIANLINSGVSNIIIIIGIALIIGILLCLLTLVGLWSNHRPVKVSVFSPLGGPRCSNGNKR